MFYMNIYFIEEMNKNFTSKTTKIIARLVNSIAHCKWLKGKIVSKNFSDSNKKTPYFE